jgi:uncharacterized protein YkwD
MKKIILTLLIALLSSHCTLNEKKNDDQNNLLVLLAIASQNANASTAASALTGEALEFQKKVNEHRVTKNCKALTELPALNRNAQNHSQDMKNRSFFSHNNPDGKTPFDRMRDDGIGYRSAGENIAMGQSTGSAVLTAWLNSSGHRANIENCNFTHHGIGYVSDGHYWTHVFAQDATVK